MIGEKGKVIYASDSSAAGPDDAGEGDYLDSPRDS